MLRNVPGHRLLVANEREKKLGTCACKILWFPKAKSNENKVSCKHCLAKFAKRCQNRRCFKWHGILRVCTRTVSVCVNTCLVYFFQRMIQQSMYPRNFVARHQPIRHLVQRNYLIVWDTRRVVSGHFWMFVYQLNSVLFQVDFLTFTELRNELNQEPNNMRHNVPQHVLASHRLTVHSIFGWGFVLSCFWEGRTVTVMLLWLSLCQTWEGRGRKPVYATSCIFFWRLHMTSG